MPDLKKLSLEIIVICSVARIVGWGFEKLGQPRGVGEMCAGILLGPSMLGWLAPPAFASLFPVDLSPLYFLSPIGLVLFMFQVGVGLDLQELQRLGRTVVLMSGISVFVPLAAGSALAFYLYPLLSNDKVSLPIFALFIGTAMSITAFSLLARILEERNLLRSQVGAVAISCAAVDDITGRMTWFGNSVRNTG